MPFKMTGKSPLTKALLGKQGKLPENLKAAIKAAPGTSPGKMKKSSPAKVGEGGAIMRSLSNSGIVATRFGGSLGLSEKEDQARKRKEQQEEIVTEGAASNETGGDSNQNKFDPNVGRTKGGKLTYSQAYKNASASVKEKYGNSEAAFTKAAKEYNAKQKVTPAATTTPATKPLKVGFSVGAASASLGGERQGGTPGVSTVKVGGSGGAKATFGKKAINRSGSFTDEYGNTYDRDVKGRKKADGSVSKTISNKTNDVTTREKDVTKGPKVKGKRKDKTVTKTKFDREGEVKKVVTKTRGKKREVSSDSDAKEKREKILADRKRRDESPTKMVKSPAKNYKKGYYK
jgi:hypothetical protein